jgi:hypothetical protein
MEIEINKYTGRFSKRQNINFTKSLRIKGAGEIFWKVINLGFNKVSVPKVFVKICRVVLGDKIAKFNFIYMFHPDYIFAIGKEFKDEIQKFMNDPTQNEPTFIFDKLIEHNQFPKSLEAFLSSTKIKVDSDIISMCTRKRKNSEAEILNVLEKFMDIDVLLKHRSKIIKSLKI